MEGQWKRVLSALLTVTLILAVCALAEEVPAKEAPQAAPETPRKPAEDETPRESAPETPRKPAEDWAPFRAGDAEDMSGADAPSRLPAQSAPAAALDWQAPSGGEAAPSACAHLGSTRQSVTPLSVSYACTERTHAKTVQKRVDTICDECGRVIRSVLVNATDKAQSHRFADGVCTVCGYACAHRFSGGRCAICGMPEG